eukprot:g24041.t1
MTYKAWAQEAADAASEAMKTARAAEFAAGQARRYKYYTKSAREAAQNALKELEGHLAKERVDPAKMHIYVSQYPEWMLVLLSVCCKISSTSRSPDFL